MSDTLATLGGIAAFLSFICFIISFFMLFFEKSRKLGLKLLIGSIITFVIGFGTCAANFSMNMH